MSEVSVIGATGVVIVATRGSAGPGEVSLRIGGGTESYLAWSDEPLPRGAEVLVTDRRGPRTVEVAPLDDVYDPREAAVERPSPPSDPLLEL